VDGIGLNARFVRPSDIAISPNNIIYVADCNIIRKITTDAKVTTIAGSSSVYAYKDGQSFDARFYIAAGITIDPSTNNIFVSDAYTNTIRMINSTGWVSTIGGDGTFNNGANAGGYKDGPGNSSLFSNPYELEFYNSALFVVDYGNNRIRKLSYE
jgi:DNA-binding beta-propeller fold protein YncE